MKNIDYKVNDDGLKELMLAILIQAIKDDIMRYRTLPTDFRSSNTTFRIQKKAEKWMDSKECISYCDVLNINYCELMKRIEKEKLLHGMTWNEL